MADSGEKEIRSVIEETTDALNEGDATKLDLLLSDRSGAIHIGTDPGERWTKQQLLSNIKEAISVGGNQLRAELDEIHVDIDGDLAWTEGTARFVNEKGAQRAVRITGVLVREGGRWKLAQSHASIGVPNEELF